MNIYRELCTESFEPAVRVKYNKIMYMKYPFILFHFTCTDILQYNKIKELLCSRWEVLQ